MSIRTISATLKTCTPLHIGSGRSSDAADDLLRRDARGRLLIPGPSLAGALRSIATRLAPRLGAEPCQALQSNPPRDQACGCLVCQLFGDVNPQETEGQASMLIVYDAVLGDARTVIRDGVGIDRVTGAAARAERLKFDLEVLPAGAIFELRMELDPYFDNEQALELLAASLAEWQAGRGAVGGRVARGLGAFTLEKVTFLEEPLANVEAVMAFLREGPAWEKRSRDGHWVAAQTQQARARIIALPQAQKDLPVARSWALAEFILAADGPFLINDPVQAARGGFDHAPLLATYDKNGRPVLPGSSFRGVLRSQAERIARTLATLADPGDGAHFKTHCPACNPLTTHFEDPVASCNSFIKQLPAAERRKLDREGAEAKLCLVCRLFGSPWNGSRLRVEDAYLKPGTAPKLKVMDFLAIDRFTGGGREGAKFDAVVLWRPEFKVRLFLENPQPWELGWLALTLRDLHEGLTTVGFGGAKGFGRVHVESPQLTLGYLHDDDLWALAGSDAGRSVAHTLARGEKRFSGLYATLAYAEAQQDSWLALAHAWVQAFNQTVNAHQRPQGFDLTQDSYFASQLPELYPLEVEHEQ